MAPNRKPREAEERIILKDNFDGAFFIDLTKMDPNYDYSWVREYNGNVYDTANVHDATNNRKWEPVLAEEYPNLVIGNKIEDRQEESKYIRLLGSILMKRPKSIGNQVKKELRDITKQKTDASKLISNISGKDMPGFIDKDEDSISVRNNVAFQE